MKLLWLLAVFLLVIIAVFLPATRVFSDLVYGAQDARLYSEAKHIATVAGGLSSEGSATTIEVSVPSGNIVIGPGYVEARTGRGKVKRFSANLDGGLTLGEGKHLLMLSHDGTKVIVSLQ